MPKMDNPYDILGIPANATSLQVRKAYKDRAHECHPDMGGDPETYRLVVWAYSILRDSAKRKMYDETGKVDESSVFTNQNKMTALIVQSFDAVLSGAAGLIDLTNIRVIEQLKGVVNSHLQKSLAAQENLLSNRQVMQKIIDKTKLPPDGKKGILVAVMESKITQIDAALKELEATLIIQRMAVEELEPYQTLEDAIDHMHLNMWAGSTTSSSTVNSTFNQTW